jgi:glycine C-acetyltransferase
MSNTIKDRNPAVVLASMTVADRFPAADARSCAEAALARLTGMPDSILFKDATQAVFATLGALLRPGDRIFIDRLASAHLSDAVAATGLRSETVPHGWVECFENRLQDARRTDRTARLAVLCDAFSAFDCRPADLVRLRSACDRQGALMIVDVSNDLGVLGRSGRGVAEVQGMVGEADAMTGSLGMAFASQAGFAALRDPSNAAGLRAASDPSMTVPAEEVMRLDQALQDAGTKKGAWTRARLMSHAMRLRDGLAAEGFRPRGEPGAIVSVPLGDRLHALAMTSAHSAHQNRPALCEYRLGTREVLHWEYRIGPSHTTEDIDETVAMASRALRRTVHLAAW